MFFQLFHSHKMHFFRPFYRPKWHISLPFHILQLSKSRNRYPFILPEPWLKKGTPFERSLRVQAIIRSPPPRDGQYTFIFFCNFLFILLIEVLEPCCLLSPDESLVWSSGYREVVKSFNGCVRLDAALLWLTAPWAVLLRNEIVN